MKEQEISVEVESNSDYGDVVFFDGIFEKLGLEESIDSHSPKRNSGFSVGKTSRLIVDCYCTNLRENKSKLEIPKWYKDQTTLQDRLKLAPEEIGEQDLYRCLEYLPEDVQKKVINDYVTLLAIRHNLNMNCLLEDISSTYFEGGNCSIAKNGYSRDHRPDLKQVNIELAVTKDNHFPVKHSTYEGNIPDKKRGDQIPGELRDQYPNLSTTLVVDRGLASESNRKAMIKEGFDYVAALEIESKIKHLVLSIEDDEFKEEDELKEKGLKVSIKEGELEGKRVLNYIYYNPDKAKEERREREKKINKAQKEILKLQERVDKGTLRKQIIILKRAIKILKSHKVNLYFNTKVEIQGRTNPQIVMERKEKAFREKEKLDGKFVIQTILLDKTPSEVLNIYRSKDGVEKAFDVFKNLIKVRPIRHWNEARVKGHIFLCILAYLVVSVAKYVIKEAKIGENLKKIHSRLHQVRQVVVKVIVGDSVIRKETITGLDELSRGLLSLVGIKPPADRQI